LLHIIGLKETKAGSKKLISPKPEEERDAGSLIENAVTILKYEDCLAQVEPSGIGSNKEDQLYNIALELVITWINRILFLKLLEGQLVRYHDGDEAFKFLNIKRIPDYDTLNKLFFQVLAVKENERNEPVKQRFGNIPYLNSSLFEPNDLEHKTIRISNLEDEYKLPVPGATVLKDNTGKRLKGEMNTLQYLFEFLDAYDFASEGTEEIQEESKTLINASVLGLIFEKINGYKEGSFFTPGFITMYMCRETIRRAVVQKFNEAKGWNCKSPDDIYDKIDDKKEANRIINSLRICDPAVGSGHFLVSALNEIITIKSELKILLDRNGRTLRDYHVEVANDELVITDEDGNLYEYNPRNRESQRIQEALFHEKQTIIENCLFGVDINPNSVKICRLRLWIELLKSAYYKKFNSQGLTLSQTLTNQLYELETLPNIDINIKCGNSLISRYPLDADIKKALRNSKWSIDSYRLAVMTYRNAQSKEEKREMEKLIEQIKKDFESEIALNDKRVLRLNRLKGELTTLTTQTSIFDKTKAEKARWEKEVIKVTAEIQKLETELEEIRSNKIYENAFEWRFEFPEVLNDDGDFTGFDVVIGNPPYINYRDIKSVKEKTYLSNRYSVSEYQSDLFILFIEISYNLLMYKGQFSYIVPNSITNNLNNSKIRKFILNKSMIYSIVNTPIGVFPDATVDTIVISTTLHKIGDNTLTAYDSTNQNIKKIRELNQNEFESNRNFYFDFLTDRTTKKIIQNIEKETVPLISITDSSSGIKEYETGKGVPPQTEEDRKAKVFNSKKKIDKTFRKHVVGADILPYIINWKGNYLKYGQWLAAPRNFKFFMGERLIIREIPGHNKLIAAYTNKNYTVKNTAHIFIPNSDFNVKYLIGLLNSKLFGFYFINKFSERDKVFPKAKIGQCRLLPIKSINKDNQKAIIKKVDRILYVKKQELNSDTTALEAEIDRMVYDLYGLTEEEKKIVEEAVR